MSVYAAFEGATPCERLPGADGGPGERAGWRLRGGLRAPGPGVAPEQAELLLNGTRDFELPAQLESPLLWHEAPTAGGVRWLLRSAAAAAGAGEPPREWELPLRSVQLHLGASTQLQSLFTPAPAPWTMRALAWLLLNLARIPGVASLFARRSGG